MRFLCLHGMGTNSKILEMQTAAIRHGLGDEHSYEYIDGALPTMPGPGADMITKQDDALEYFQEESQASFVKALDDLEIFVQQEGPFDGVMGFSAGATLAFALMVRKMTNNPSEERLCPTFKCAVFFSAVLGKKTRPTGSPPPPTEDSSTWGPLSADREMIQVPTAHIWGENDHSFPNSGSWLYPFCRRDKSSKFVHPYGHEIPGLKDREATMRAVRVIKRTIAIAVSG